MWTWLNSVFSFVANGLTIYPYFRSLKEFKWGLSLIATIVIAGLLIKRNISRQLTQALDLSDENIRNKTIANLIKVSPGHKFFINRAIKKIIKNNSGEDEFWVRALYALDKNFNEGGNESLCEPIKNTQRIINEALCSPDENYRRKQIYDISDISNVSSRQKLVVKKELIKIIERRDIEEKLAVKALA